MEEVAIVVLNYNTSADCRKCVSYLKRQVGVEVEIVVVDNCSRPDDVKTLRRMCAEQGCTLIENHENRGYNAGNNIGWRYAVSKGYEYALIANPDMEFPQKDYIANLLDCMVHSETVMVGSDIITPSGIHQNPMREISYWEEFWWWGTILKNRKTHHWFSCDYTKSGVCEKLSGCCFLIDLNFVKQIGYFDENVFLYSEEPILAKQVQMAGRQMYYCADVQAIHCHIKSEKGDPRKRMQVLFHSRKYYLCNYSGYKRIKLYLILMSKQIQKILYRLFK